MRIAIISHALHAGGGISVGRNLIASICNIAQQHQYLISIPTDLNYEGSIGKGAQVVSFSGRSNLVQRILFEQTRLAPALRRFQPELILALGNHEITGFDCPQAILCHRPHLWYPRAHHGPHSTLGAVTSRVRNTLQAELLQRALKKPRNILLYQTQTARGV